MGHFEPMGACMKKLLLICSILTLVPLLAGCVYHRPYGYYGSGYYGDRYRDGYYSRDYRRDYDNRYYGDRYRDYNRDRYYDYDR